MSISGVGSGSGAGGDKGDIGRSGGAADDARFAGLLAAAALKGEGAGEADQESSQQSKPGFGQRLADASAYLAPALTQFAPLEPPPVKPAPVPVEPVPVRPGVPAEPPPAEGIGRGLFWVGAGLLLNDALHRLAGPQPIYMMDKSMGGDLHLVVYGGTRKGPSGEDAHFYRSGPSGEQQMLNVPVRWTEKGLAYDPAALERAYGAPLPADARAPLTQEEIDGINAAKRRPEDDPSHPVTQPGSGIETRTQEESDLVATLQAQGKSNVEIQNALDAMRAHAAHRKNLGSDPDTKGFRENEAETALRVERKLNIRLERYQPPSPGMKGDWVDLRSRKVYDGCSPPDTKFFDRQMSNGNYQKSLLDHVNHSNVDYVVIDLTGLNLTPAQAADLNSLIGGLTAQQQAKIIRIP